MKLRNKEPKDFYYINENGGVLRYIPSDPNGEDLAYMKYQNQIGNYFTTEEEAEKAVEKLKAWKRLKDKGFKFKDFGRLNDCATFIRATHDESWSELYDDLNSLFGGEE